MTHAVESGSTVIIIWHLSEHGICGYTGGEQASADKTVTALAENDSSQLSKFSAMYNAGDDREKKGLLSKARKKPILPLEEEQFSTTTCWRCACCLQATPAGMTSCLRCNAEFMMYDGEIRRDAEQGAMPPGSSRLILVQTKAKVQDHRRHLPIQDMTENQRRQQINLSLIHI